VGGTSEKFVPEPMGEDITVGKASNTKFYIELMSSSSCFGLARLLCSEAFDFTQYH